MVWYIVSIIAFVAAAALLIWTRIKDRRYEHKNASEAMRPEVWSEIEEERKEILERQEKFRRALNDAQSRSGQTP